MLCAVSVPSALTPEARSLFDRFDPLFASGSLSTRDEEDLLSLARVFDLETDQPPVEVWRRLRSLIERQSDFADRPVTTCPEMRVMVVEDDPVMGADLAGLLTDAGHAVVGPFTTAEAAWLALSMDAAVDALLLDINLAGIETGVDLAARVTARGGPPIVFLSGDVTLGARHAELARRIVFKPWREGEVLEALSAAVSPTGLAA